MLHRCRKNSHNRTEITEEAIRRVSQRGDSKDMTLRHATSVPRYQDGRYGCTVFASSAEQTRLQTISFVCRSEHRGRKYNAEILVSTNNIEEHTCKCCCGNKGNDTSDKSYQCLHNGVEHACYRHCCTKEHSTNNQPNSVQHASHASCCYKVIQFWHSCIEISLAIHHDQSSTQTLRKAFKVSSGYLIKQFSLCKDCSHSAHQRGQKEHNHRGQTHCDKQACEERNNQQPR